MSIVGDSLHIDIHPVLPPARMQLACDHWILWPDEAERRADGWYAAQPCPWCKRKRSVVCASFSAPVVPAYYQAIEQRSEA